MTRRGDLKLSHGATAKARENAVKQDRVPTTNAIKSPRKVWVSVPDGVYRRDRISDPARPRIRGFVEYGQGEAAGLAEAPGMRTLLFRAVASRVGLRAAHCRVRARGGVRLRDCGTPRTEADGRQASMPAYRRPLCGLSLLEHYRCRLGRLRSACAISSVKTLNVSSMIVLSAQG